MEVFQIQRAAGLANLGRTLDSKYTDWRAHTKDTALWNIDEGMKLSSQEILESEQLRAEIYANIAAFFEFDHLLDNLIDRFGYHDFFARNQTDYGVRYGLDEFNHFRIDDQFRIIEPRQLDHSPPFTGVMLVSSIN